MKKIDAKIIADSVCPRGHRITTFILTYPRIIHGELMTHRMFSRNAASSRAIPFERMVKEIEEDPFIPIAWQKQHKGMQGKEYLTDELSIEFATSNWLQAKRDAIKNAKSLHSTKNGYESVTKQLCNRLLEPFQWMTTLVTATQFENFFSLRCPSYVLKEYNDYEELVNTYTFKSKKDALKEFPNFYHKDKGKFTSDFTDLDWLEINESQAEIHIQMLAEIMYDARNESNPKELKENQWHIPFGDKMDEESIMELGSRFGLYNNIKLKIATARAARISYTTHDGEIDYEKDIALHDMLLESRHASPFEHCAVVPTEKVMNENSLDFIDREWFDNLEGWQSYRNILEI